MVGIEYLQKIFATRARHPNEVLLQVYQLIMATGESVIVSLSDIDPILMACQRGLHSNYRVMINIDPEAGFLGFTASHELWVPQMKIREVCDFLLSIETDFTMPIAFDSLTYNVWAATDIPASDGPPTDADIAYAYYRAGKALDDLMPALLSMIYGGMTIRDAVAEFQMAQRVSISDWIVAKGTPNNAPSHLLVPC